MCIFFSLTAQNGDWLIVAKMENEKNATLGRRAVVTIYNLVILA
jgi:hypothetical protein